MHAIHVCALSQIISRPIIVVLDNARPTDDGQSLTLCSFRALFTERHRDVITFCVSRRRRKMYCGHARLCVSLCVCVSVRGRMPTVLHGPGCNLGQW